MLVFSPIQVIRSIGTPPHRHIRHTEAPPRILIPRYRRCQLCSANSSSARPNSPPSSRPACVSWLLFARPSPGNAGRTGCICTAPLRLGSITHSIRPTANAASHRFGHLTVKMLIVGQAALTLLAFFAKYRRFPFNLAHAISVADAQRLCPFQHICHGIP